MTVVGGEVVSGCGEVVVGVDGDLVGGGDAVMATAQKRVASGVNVVWRSLEATEEKEVVVTVAPGSGVVQGSGAVSWTQKVEEVCGLRSPQLGSSFSSSLNLTDSRLDCKYHMVIWLSLGPEFCSAMIVSRAHGTRCSCCSQVQLQTCRSTSGASPGLTELHGRMKKGA